MEQALLPKKFNMVFKANLIIILTLIMCYAIHSVIKHELKGSMWFFIGLYVLIIPDLWSRLFGKPYAGQLTATYLNFSYLFRAKKSIAVATILGFSTTAEYTKAGVIKGIVLYLNDGEKIQVTETNIISIAPLIKYLTAHQIKAYGEDRVRPWFLSERYKYS